LIVKTGAAAPPGGVKELLLSTNPAPEAGSEYVSTSP